MRSRKKLRKELWARLLSDRRLYGLSYPRDENSRSEYQRDYDRIVFSSAFRRLQDKTQVFPLSQTDYTRTRLTHTLETSSVARTLGLLAGNYLLKLGVVCEPHEVGTIVATAALAHDLGNPPFGHSGEAAIQSWAKKRLTIPGLETDYRKMKISTRRNAAATIPMTREEIADFHLFEGNSQGFRVLVRTSARTRKGGLRPTIATLGAMTKYPRPSVLTTFSFQSSNISEKKPGYFQNDKKMAIRAFDLLGMPKKHPGVYSRHPLAFLTEAADDICYALADIEDGFKVGAVTFNDVCDVLLPLASMDPRFKDQTYLGELARLSKARSAASGILVSESITAFRDALEEAEDGSLDVPVLHRTPVLDKYTAVLTLAKEKVYRHDRVLLIEYAGYQTIGGLLDMFHAALCEQKDSSKEGKLRDLLPLDFFRRPHTPKPPKGSKVRDTVDFYLECMTPYERLLAVTDYVSGMTDRIAVQLFQRLSGIRLPE